MESACCVIFIFKFSYIYWCLISSASVYTNALIRVMPRFLNCDLSMKIDNLLNILCNVGHDTDNARPPLAACSSRVEITNGIHESTQPSLPNPYVYQLKPIDDISDKKITYFYINLFNDINIFYCIIL